MMAALFDPVTPGIGNLVTEGSRSKDTQRIRRTVFSTVLHLRYARDCNLFSCPPVCEACGSAAAYLLPQTTLALMCAIMFIGLTRFATDSFRYAFGLFADTGAPVAETVASLTLSTLLGSHYGLDGILTKHSHHPDGRHSHLETILPHQPPHARIRATYVRLYLSHLAAGAITAAAVDTALTHTSAGLRLTEIASLSAAGFAMAAAVTTATTAIILAVIMTACFKPFRRFAARIKHHYQAATPIISVIIIGLQHRNIPAAVCRQHSAATTRRIGNNHRRRRLYRQFAKRMRRHRGIRPTHHRHTYTQRRSLARPQYRHRGLTRQIHDDGRLRRHARTRPHHSAHKPHGGRTARPADIRHLRHH